MPPRNPGPGQRAAGPLLTPRGRAVAVAVLVLTLLASWAWAAIDPTFWSCC